MDPHAAPASSPADAGAPAPAPLAGPAGAPGGCDDPMTPCTTIPPKTTTPDPWPGCAPCPCTKAPFANFPAVEVQAHQAQEEESWAAYDLCRLKKSLAHLYPDAPDCFPPTPPPT